MILYKYVGFDAGLAILETQTIGFSLPRDFNDPFEGTALALKGKVAGISVESGAVRNRFINKYAVLSLTRAPLNPLMWSHYADSHKGMVIGIDTEKAGLESFNDYLIPAQRGEMIYLNTVPKLINSISSEQLMQIGNPELISWESSERLLKHAFLYKQLCWAYEEEVRVVKCLGQDYISYHSIDDKKIKINGEEWERKHLSARAIFLKKIPINAFVEIYVGENNYRDQRRQCQNLIDGYKVPKIENLKLFCRQNNINFLNVSVDKETWSLKSNIQI